MPKNNKPAWWVGSTRKPSNIAARTNLNYWVNIHQFAFTFPDKEKERQRASGSEPTGHLQLQKLHCAKFRQMSENVCSMSPDGCSDSECLLLLLINVVDMLKRVWWMAAFRQVRKKRCRLAKVIRPESSELNIHAGGRTGRSGHRSERETTITFSTSCRPLDWRHFVCVSVTWRTNGKRLW